MAKRKRKARVFVFKNPKTGLWYKAKRTRHGVRIVGLARRR